VTTTRITHATPAAGYSHVADRAWEGSVPSSIKGNCKDIARQLIEDEPGSKLKVILGGGRGYFLPNNVLDSSGKYGMRTDNKSLIDDWLNSKNQSGLDKSAYQFVNSTSGLNNVDYTRTEYLFGLFNYTHMAYDMERDLSENGESSLEQMTEAAIKILNKNDNGFVLLVEGGRIDHAHHDNYAALSLYETLAFEKAIERLIVLYQKTKH